MKKIKINWLHFSVAFVIAALLIGLDQLTKLLFEKALLESPTHTLPFINNFIFFDLVYNKGAGWGILSGQKFLLVGLSLVMSIGLVVVLAVVSDFKKRRFLTIIVILLLGGTTGNLIDRAFYPNGVIDFIKFDFWPLHNFPTFNLADSFLSIGAVLLLIYVLFIYKEPKKDGENNA